MPKGTPERKTNPSKTFGMSDRFVQAIGQYAIDDTVKRHLDILDVFCAMSIEYNHPRIKSSFPGVGARSISPTVIFGYL